MTTRTRLLIAIPLLILAATGRWWLPPLLDFVGANSDTIQGLADLIQIILWVAAGAALFLGIRQWRRGRTQSGGIHARDIEASAGSARFRDETGAGADVKRVRAGQDVEVTTIGGDTAPKSRTPGAGPGIRQHLEDIEAARDVTVIGQQIQYLPSLPADPEIQLREAEQALSALPLDHLPDPGPLPAGSRPLFAPNPLFVGRQPDLLQLARTLRGGDTAVIGQIAAATGLGGIGKTQLATEFIHRYGRHFLGGVYWLSFANADAIPAEVIECGMNMRQWPDFEHLDGPTQVRLVRQAWESPLPRLLIFDNCEDETLLQQWRPRSGGCRVLVTSRRSHWDPVLGVRNLALGVLEREESVELLRKHRPDLAQADADAIADELGDLPLALHLAGSFLHRYANALTPGDYLGQLRRPDLLEHHSLQKGGISPTDHKQHVARTFTLSLERLDAADTIDGIALALLARSAHFAPGEPIPGDLLSATLSEGDALAHSDALRRLSALGLLEPLAASGEAEIAYRLHRLLAAFVLASVEDAEAEAGVEQTMLKRADELNNAGYPAPLLALQNHLRHIVDVARPRRDERAAALCNTMGYHLDMTGDYAGARPYYEQALAINQKVLGERHPHTARSLNNLGFLLKAQGDYAGARPYYEQALAICQEVLGERHPATASSLNNLGLLLQAQGDYAGARPYYEQALAIRTEVLGERHPDTAGSLNNLGGLLSSQGDYVGARPYYEQALAIYQEVLGERHPDTAGSLNNLGFLLKAQGDYAGAKPYYEQALAIRKRVLGERHPHTASSLNNLGALLDSQGDYAGARPYYEQALAIYQEVLGERHPDTASSLNNLGFLLQAQGDYAGARPYYEQALAIRKEVLGERHPATAGSLNNLAISHYDENELSEAARLMRQALSIWEATLGIEHPQTKQTRESLTVIETELQR